MKKVEPIDIVFSFDTTSSMMPCISQVRRTITETVKKLFKDIPRLRVGIIAHGDYCDIPPHGPYVIKMLDLTTNQKEIVKFVEGVEQTWGGDAPECYELVLNEARRMTWSAGKQKVLVMIGDDVPHEKSYIHNTKNLDWKNEIAMLREGGIHVYGVQALNRPHATKFYKQVAKGSEGIHLNLNQFRHVVDLVMGVCYKQQGKKELAQYQDLVQTSGRMNRDLAQIFGALSGKKVAVAGLKKAGLDSVSPGRFQIFSVWKDVPIQSFCDRMGVTFARGHGFYEFGKKTVTVQEKKEVILEHKVSGDLFSGNKARKMIGLPFGKRGSLKPRDTKLDDFNIFIQSTSNNRKLLKDTRFLYEVPSV